MVYLTALPKKRPPKKWLFKTCSRITSFAIDLAKIQTTDRVIVEYTAIVEIYLRGWRMKKY